MTRTEILNEAWRVLNSADMIREMLEEVDAKPDEIEATKGRFANAAVQHIDAKKDERLASITQQMALLGLTPDDVTEFLTRPVKRKIPKNPNRINKPFAEYKGKKIGTMGAMPAWAKDLGWTKREDIPQEYHVA